MSAVPGHETMHLEAFWGLLVESFNMSFPHLVRKSSSVTHAMMSRRILRGAQTRLFSISSVDVRTSPFAHISFYRVRSTIG
jgi:hypothetical protein